MQYFTPAFVQFFRDLSDNNNSEWFHANKKTYEREVKKPFETFVADLISGITRLDPEVNITPKEAIKRINRDIRFSRNKEPYNTQMAAIISRTGKSDKSCPGIYVGLSHQGVQAFGGVYMAEPDAINRIRHAIAADIPAFQKLYRDPAFKSLYGDFHGEKNKVLPPDLKAAAEKEPLIFNKQFFFGAELPTDLITSDELLPKLVDCYKVSVPVNAFFQKAMKR